MQSPSVVNRKNVMLNWNKEANSHTRCVPDAKTRYTHDEHVWENAPPRNAIAVYILFWYVIEGVTVNKSMRRSLLQLRGLSFKRWAAHRPTFLFNMLSVRLLVRTSFSHPVTKNQ